MWLWLEFRRGRFRSRTHTHTHTTSTIYVHAVFHKVHVYVRSPITPLDQLTHTHTQTPVLFTLLPIYPLWCMKTHSHTCPCHYIHICMSLRVQYMYMYIFWRLLMNLHVHRKFFTVLLNVFIFAGTGMFLRFSIIVFNFLKPYFNHSSHMLALLKSLGITVCSKYGHSCVYHYTYMYMHICIPLHVTC